ncbi:MAG: HDOD domain-containing protein [Betaproteobacteria bacterium]|nr:HDOD domain-containing protein [Betaproteobacteria bacterium]
MIVNALPSLEAWSRLFCQLEVPILRESAVALAAMIEDEDRASPIAIGRLAQADPLLTLRILALAARHRSRRAVTDTETAVTGVVMMGLGRFFDDFRSPTVVEDLLADDPEALAGLQQVIDRGFRAAGFALGFAVHRLDTDAEVIQEAAMLHDFAEMLLWCRAPALARRIRDRQAADPALRSAQAQLEVLNIRLHDLQRALMQAWHLPELLAQITDRDHLDNPQVRNVVLAVDIARHTQFGWDNPAVPDDLTEIGRLLNLTPESARRKVMGLDA